MVHHVLQESRSIENVCGCYEIFMIAQKVHPAIHVGSQKYFCGAETNVALY